MINILNDFLEIFLCVYAVVRHTIGRTISKDSNIYFIYEVVYIGLALLVYIITLLLSLPLAIFRKLLNAYISVKFGSRCYGLLDDIDAVWSSESEESKHIVNSIIFIQLTKTPQDFIKRIKQKIKDTRNRSFNSSLHNILGYWYTMHSNTIVDDMVQPITLTHHETSDKFAFENRISRLANQALPKLSMYEILVSVDPIKFYGSTDEESKNYVIIIRVHHVIGDGFQLVSFLQSIADTNSELNPSSINAKISLCSDKNIDENAESNFSKDLFLNYLTNAMHAIKNASAYYFGLTDLNDNNILHGPTLSGNKTLVFHLEENPEYIRKVKSIKSRIEECTFSDVLYAALSASLYEHFSKYTQNIPKNITMTFISRFKKYFATATLKIPIQIDKSLLASKKLSRRLDIIIKSRKKMQRSIDPMIFHWLSRGCSLLPTPLARRLCKLSMKTTLSFSNLPGISTFVTIDGEPIKDLVFWTPNVATIGIGFSSFSYNGRLQMGLIADKLLLPAHEDASSILENVFKNIDLLAEEINIT